MIARTITCGKCKGRGAVWDLSIPFRSPCSHCAGVGVVDFRLYRRPVAVS